MRDYIVYVAIHEEVDPALALSIAQAESNFVASAKNPNSSASSIFQYLDSTFQEYCINKFHFAPDMSQKNVPAVQVNCAIEMLKEPNGYLHWLPSKNRWGKYTALTFLQ